MRCVNCFNVVTATSHLGEKQHPQHVSAVGHGRTFETDGALSTEGLMTVRSSHDRTLP